MRTLGTFLLVIMLASSTRAAADNASPSSAAIVYSAGEATWCSDRPRAKGETPAASSRVRGRVIEQGSGRPVAGVLIAVLSISATAGGLTTSDQADASATPNNQGLFAIERVRAPLFQLVAHAPGFRTATVSLGPGTHCLDIQLVRSE
jgi:hypothetical protein